MMCTGRLVRNFLLSRHSGGVFCCMDGAQGSWRIIMKNEKEPLFLVEQLMDHYRPVSKKDHLTPTRYDLSLLCVSTHTRTRMSMHLAQSGTFLISSPSIHRSLPTVNHAMSYITSIIEKDRSSSIHRRRRTSPYNTTEQPI